MASKRRYPQVMNHQEFSIKFKNTKLCLACCDCGLVHNLGFAVDGNNLGIAVEIDYKETAKHRRSLLHSLANKARRKKR